MSSMYGFEVLGPDGDFKFSSLPFVTLESAMSSVPGAEWSEESRGRWVNDRGDRIEVRLVKEGIGSPAYMEAARRPYVLSEDERSTLGSFVEAETEFLNAFLANSNFRRFADVEDMRMASNFRSLLLRYWDRPVERDIVFRGHNSWHLNDVSNTLPGVTIESWSADEVMSRYNMIMGNEFEWERLDPRGMRGHFFRTMTPRGLVLVVQGDSK